jgi:hypothetical protein
MYFVHQSQLFLSNIYRQHPPCNLSYIPYKNSDATISLQCGFSRSYEWIYNQKFCMVHLVHRASTYVYIICCVHFSCFLKFVAYNFFPCREIFHKMEKFIDDNRIKAILIKENSSE